MSYLKWTKRDLEFAGREGWGLFDYRLGANWVLEKLDEMNKFSSDEEAWKHVVQEAEAGGLLHIKALAFLCIEDQVEFDKVAASASDDLVAHIKSVVAWSRRKS